MGFSWIMGFWTLDVIRCQIEMVYEDDDERNNIENRRKHSRMCHHQNPKVFGLHVPRTSNHSIQSRDSTSYNNNNNNGCIHFMIFRLGNWLGVRFWINLGLYCLWTSIHWLLVSIVDPIILLPFVLKCYLFGSAETRWNICIPRIHLNQSHSN